MPSSFCLRTRIWARRSEKPCCTAKQCSTPSQRALEARSNPVRLRNRTAQLRGRRDREGAKTRRHRKEEAEIGSLFAQRFTASRLCGLLSVRPIRKSTQKAPLCDDFSLNCLPRRVDC